MSTNTGYFGWPTTKKNTGQNVLKQSTKKRNLDKNINDSKSHICNSYLENIISARKTFYNHPYLPVDIIRVFLISDFLTESLRANLN